MNDYYVIIIIATFIILGWYFGKDKLRGLIHKQDIATFANIDLDELKEKQFKNIYTSSLLLILWPICHYSLFYLIVCISSIILSYYWTIIMVKQAEKEEIKRLKYDFPIWLRQLQVLLQNNNVLHSLELSEENAPLIIKDKLHKLIAEIRVNATSGEPYYNFMKEYGIYEINRAMKLLYRYHMSGNEDSYYQFQRMLESTAKWLRQEREEKRKSTIDMMNWIGFVPLLSSTAMFMVLMVMVLSEMLKGGIGL